MILNWKACEETFSTPSYLGLWQEIFPAYLAPLGRSQRGPTLSARPGSGDCDNVGFYAHPCCRMVAALGRPTRGWWCLALQSPIWEASSCCACSADPLVCCACHKPGSHRLPAVREQFSRDSLYSRDKLQRGSRSRQSIWKSMQFLNKPKSPWQLRWSWITSGTGILTELTYYLKLQ